MAHRLPLRSLRLQILTPEHLTIEHVTITAPGFSSEAEMAEAIVDILENYYTVRDTAIDTDEG